MRLRNKCMSAGKREFSFFSAALWRGLHILLTYNMSPPRGVAGLVLLTMVTAGSVQPIPEGLWQPGKHEVSERGNFVYLSSQPGDVIGGGKSYTYTPLNSFLGINELNDRLEVEVQGNEQWKGDFKDTESLAQVQVGYYGDLERYSYDNVTAGGMLWSGSTGDCEKLSGWFAVDTVTYKARILIHIKLRFEQYCDGGPALRGAVQWSVMDKRQPAGPVSTPPSALWQPDPAAIPNTETYVHLQSDFGDVTGGGGNYTYTPSNANLTVRSSSPLLSVRVADQGTEWAGDFMGMDFLPQLQPGYYGDLPRYPLHNSAKGGLSWGKNGSVCLKFSGWFAVDSIQYTNWTLTAVKLRFEQHCDEATPALHGVISYQAVSYS